MTVNRRTQVLVGLSGLLTAATLLLAGPGGGPAAAHPGHDHDSDSGSSDNSGPSSRGGNDTCAGGAGACTVRPTSKVGSKPLQ